MNVNENVKKEIEQAQRLLLVENDRENAPTPFDMELHARQRAENYCPGINREEKTLLALVAERESILLKHVEEIDREIQHHQDLLLTLRPSHNILFLEGVVRQIDKLESLRRNEENQMFKDTLLLKKRVSEIERIVDSFRVKES